jgi:hypothetical protein
MTPKEGKNFPFSLFRRKLSIKMKINFFNGTMEPFGGLKFQTKSSLSINLLADVILKLD